ncbi:MAG: helicase-associated domain-containing protein [Anaerolineae bacterium]
MRNSKLHPERSVPQSTETSPRPTDIRAVVEQPASVALASAPNFQRDLSRYWRHVRNKGEVALTARGWIYKTAFRALLAALNESPGKADSEQEHPRLCFMRQLLVGLGELVETQGAITAQPGGQFFNMSLPARIRKSFETWRDTAAFARADWARPDALRDGLAQAIKARAVVLRALARAEKALALEHSLGIGHAPQSAGVIRQERWMSVAALLDSVARPETADTIRLPDRLAAQRESALSMLAGPLHWLGLVDLGYDTADNTRNGNPNTPGNPLPTAYRLTETGLWLLDLADEPRFVESGGRVLVQPNFTILAMEPISDRVLMDLDQFADLQGGDRATTYQLTRQSVYRGHRAGWDVQRIVSFLEAHQGAPVPPNIRRTLDEWQAQHHRIVFYRAAQVIQFADDAARAAVTDVLSQAGMTLVALGPAHALLEPGAPVASVVATLRDAGWMPEVSLSGQDSDDTESCLRLVPSRPQPTHPEQPDVQAPPDSFDVVFKQPAPSLFALGQLAPLAGPVAPGRPLQITAASVRSALSAGMTLDEILATLAHLHDGPLPLTVEQRIRDWARFFGRASATMVCLFEFSSQDVLNNLLDDEAVGHYLRLIEGSLQAVAVVDAAHAGLVRGLLAERGIQISDIGPL